MMAKAQQHSYEAVVARIHDHLYSNANMRAPERLQREFAKVVRTLLWRQQNSDYRASLDGFEASRMPIDQLALIGSTVREDYISSSGGASDANAIGIELDDASVGYVATALEPFDMTSHDRDWLGDGLEVFRGIAAKRIGGQFFTDQRVTQLAMDLLEYDPQQHDMLDICAGSGGFLLAGSKRSQQVPPGLRQPLVGVEIDSSVAALAESTVGELSGEHEGWKLYTGDSLRDPNCWPASLRRSVVPGTHQRLASNPPFGIKITVKDPGVLGQYDLAKAWTKQSNEWQSTSKVVPRPPDILFIERNLQLAEPGRGRVALVVPYQTLSGPKLGFVREWLLRYAKLIAVVDLPSTTFQPWTGTKTSLVVFERRAEPLPSWDESQDYPVFMAIAENIGHDRRGNPVVDAEGRVQTDLPDIGRAFANWRRGQHPGTEHDDSFVVQSTEFRRSSDLRINAGFHNPRVERIRRRLESSTDHPNFQVVRLGDVVESVFCPGRFKRNYVEKDAGVLFLGGSNITQVDPTNRKYLSKEDSHLSDFQVEPGWILVTRSGSTGIVSSVPEAWASVAISEHVIRIIPCQEKLSSAYLECFLRSQVGQELLSAGIFGSVIDEITPEFIADLLIPVPTDAEVLRRIVERQNAASDFRSRAMAELTQSELALADFFRSNSEFFLS
jgi:type I restriction enzyme M protein